MKRVCVMFLISVLLLVFTASSAISEEDVLVIPDDNLRAAIQKELGSKPITVENMYNLFELSAQGVSDLTGLEHAVRLRILRLNKCTAADYGVIGSLKVSDLFITNSNLKDISFISSTNNLNIIDFSGNQISNLQPLANYDSFCCLNLSNNKITDLSPLSHLQTLDQLNLSGNQIKDTTPLKNISHLRILHLNNNQISDVRPLAQARFVVELYLNDNLISDISPFYSIQLKTLSLNNNKISDISLFNTDFNLVTHLHLRGNKITNIQPLANLCRPMYVDIRDNQVAISSGSPSYKVIETLKKMGAEVKHDPLVKASNQVQIADTKLEAAIRSALKLPTAPIYPEDLKKLTVLSVPKQNILELDGLEYAVNLTGLNLSENPIRDYSALSKLLKLQKLELSHCPIGDLQPFSKLTGLKELDLLGSSVKDLEPILALPLTKLDVRAILIPPKMGEQIYQLKLKGVTILHDPYPGQKDPPDNSNPGEKPDVPAPIIIAEPTWSDPILGSLIIILTWPEQHSGKHAITGESAEPSQWQEGMPETITLDGPGDWYIHYHISREEKEDIVGYFGPYTIIEEDEKPAESTEPQTSGFKGFIQRVWQWISNFFKRK